MGYLKRQLQVAQAARSVLMAESGSPRSLEAADQIAANKLKRPDLGFFQSLRIYERAVFPEFRERNCHYHVDEYSEYLYFAPSWHFSRSLLTREIVDDIKRNRRQLLSVGSGRAYLEHTLVNALGVERAQITLSDLCPVMPEGFRRFRFDMRGNWPEFETSFDLVIFPESFVAIFNFDKIEEQARLRALTERAFRVLKPGGELRASGHNLYESSMGELESWLLERYPGSELDYNRFLLVIKKAARK